MLLRIVRKIKDNGPMFFDDYMEMCLYDSEEGFYAAGPVRSGKKSDFVTSPELTWAFGLCIGNWAEASRPKKESALVEFGSGTGSLIGELLDLWGDTPDQVYAVEKSAAAIVSVGETEPSVTAVGSMTDIPRGIDAVVVANEVLDNMPAALAVRTDEGWAEIAVSEERGELGLVEVPARNEVTAWCDAVFGPIRTGAVVSVQIGVDEWIANLASHFGSFSLCVVDYGDVADALLAGGVESVVRSYRKHQDGIDWLKAPGECDVTVDVNVTGLVKAIERNGYAARVTNQRAFCLEYGLAEVISDARDRERMAARRGDVMGQLQARSERLDVEAVVDPNGLGGFAVVLVEPQRGHLEPDAVA